jgi:hypothetical protein
MKHIQIHSQAPSTHRTTLPDHEHAARRARAASLGLPRKQKPTPPAPQPALFLTQRLAQPEIGGID